MLKFITRTRPRIFSKVIYCCQIGELLSKVGISQLKVFASGQNLWEATGLYKYLDPDSTGDTKDDGSLEERMTKYPFCRSYSFGINVTF